MLRGARPILLPCFGCRLVRRQTAAGDQLRVIYDSLSKDPNSLSNLDQDLPNYAQNQVCIRCFLLLVQRQMQAAWGWHSCRALLCSRPQENGVSRRLRRAAFCQVARQV